MAITWEAHAAEFKRQETEAVDNRTCFCKCGCRARGAHLRTFFGSIVPGLCPACEAETRTTKGRKAHFVVTRAADTWVEPEVDTEPMARLRRFIQRHVTQDDRQAATTYARSYGREGLTFMVAMHDKVTRGDELTDAQVEAVLRSKRAEEKSAKAAYRKAVAEHQRVGKQTDLTRIRLDGVPSGMYAVDSEAGPIIVEVERPTTGIVKGFIIVKADVGEGVRKYGVQYPQPARQPNPSTGYVQAYRGHLPQLIAVLVNDPQGARERYDSLMGKPV